VDIHVIEQKWRVVIGYSSIPLDRRMQPDRAAPERSLSLGGNRCGQRPSARSAQWSGSRVETGRFSSGGRNDRHRQALSAHDTTLCRTINMPFHLPPLPFDRAALEPHISAETLDFHHGKHHRAYVDKTNELVADAGLEGQSLVEVIRNSPPGPLRNNAGQLWNHSFFWQCLTPEPQRPSAGLAAMIAKDFGTTAELLGALADEAAAHFGSGWIWLVLERGELRIVALHDGDTPLAHKGIVPLFVLDVWEHAYYLDYRSDRTDYAKTVLGKLVNWAFVAGNLDGNAITRADQ
jgi:superoxide dismutase, Fe-Mn family